MRIRRSARAGTRANLLLISIFFLALTTFILVAYLRMVSYQNYLTMRSQTWNASMPVIEAGLEDALTHLSLHGLTNLSCDGWTQSGDIYYVIRTLGDAYYFALITNYVAGGSSKPIVECRAYLQLPFDVAAGPGPMLAQAAPPADGVKYLSRGVRLQTRSDMVFNKGLVAKGQIDINGNNITTDSFDSSDPAHNTGGLYDKNKRKANGDVATNLTLTNSLSVGNAKIYGHVSTGPKGTVSIGPNGSVGDLNWHGEDKKGIKANYSSDDMNVDFKDVEVPFSGGTTAASGSVGGTNYTYLLGTGNYLLSSLSLSSSETLMVTGKASLLIQGDLSMAGNSRIIIAPNACLLLYVQGASGDLSGNGVINQTGNATNFFYYGLPSNTSLKVTGNGAFTGVLYAPSADLTLKGGGSTDEDFIGASITKSATMDGHFNFHYDEALSKYGPFRGYVVTAWNEMTPQEVASTPITLTFLD